MILARVVGTVVATRKDPRLEGKKLLILKPISPDGQDESGMPGRAAVSIRSQPDSWPASSTAAAGRP